MLSDRKRGRPRKGGKLIETPDGYKSRVTIEKDGEIIRPWVHFETKDPRVARKKLAKTINGDAPITDSDRRRGKGDSFAGVTERILGGRVTARPEEEWRRVERAFTTNLAREDELIRSKAIRIWQGPVTSVTGADLSWVLRTVRDVGLSQSSVRHVFSSLVFLFDALMDPLEAAIRINPMVGVKVPPFKQRVEKVTEVLEDDEFFTYLAWEHPIECYQLGVQQRQVMSAVSRMFGGLRAGDLAKLKYENFTVVDGEIVSGWAPRRKKGVPQNLTVPVELRAIIGWWWTKHGRPRTGLLFPTLRASTAALVEGPNRKHSRRASEPGSERGRSSHAAAMRRDLMRAFGIEVWDPAGGARQGAGKWVVAREMTDRERALFLESEFTSPVDFHSHRRAYCQALDQVDPDNSMLAYRQKLSDHQSKAVLDRYLRRYGRALEPLPGSMPRLDLHGSPGTGILGQASARIAADATRAAKESSATMVTYQPPPTGSVPAEVGGRGVLDDGNAWENAIPVLVADERETAVPDHGGRNPRTKIAGPPLTLTDDALSDLLALATKAKRWDLTQALGAQLQALAAATPPNVASLDAARKRRDEGGAK
jgi:integrase